MQTCQSMRGGSLKITLTVPLSFDFSKYYGIKAFLEGNLVFIAYQLACWPRSMLTLLRV